MGLPFARRLVGWNHPPPAPAAGAAGPVRWACQAPSRAVSNKVLGCDWTPVWTACVGRGRGEGARGVKADGGGALVTWAAGSRGRADHVTRLSQLRVTWVRPSSAARSRPGARVAGFGCGAPGAARSVGLG